VASTPHIIDVVTVYWLLGRKPAAKKARVFHEYKAENPDELNLEVGQVIEILKQVYYASVVALQCNNMKTVYVGNTVGENSRIFSLV